MRRDTHALHMLEAGLSTRFSNLTVARTITTFLPRTKLFEQNNRHQDQVQDDSTHSPAEGLNMTSAA